jgi:hypothetical protein
METPQELAFAAHGSAAKLCAPKINACHRRLFFVLIFVAGAFYAEKSFHRVALRPSRRQAAARTTSIF